MAESADCRGDSYTGKKHVFSHTGERHANTDDVPENIATKLGKKNVREIRSWALQNYFCE